MHAVTRSRGLCGCLAVASVLLWLSGAPFNLEMDEVRTCPPLPALHSFVGKWLILGAGHLSSPRAALLVMYANAVHAEPLYIGQQMDVFIDATP